MEIFQKLPGNDGSFKKPLIVWMMQPNTNETLLDSHHKPARNEILEKLNNVAQVLFKESDLYERVEIFQDCCMITKV